MVVRSRQELSDALGERLAQAIPEASGAEIKNLVDAWCRLNEGHFSGDTITVKWASEDMRSMAE